jgi:hypothetical protein
MMAYTPELTLENICTLRRIAWAAEVPMTKALNEIVERFAVKVESRTVCSLCRDRTRCSACRFSGRS